MKYQLVLEFSGESLQDHDAIFALEDRLIAALGSAHLVDGHDMGSGQMNIFVHSNDPTDAFSIAKTVIPEETLGRALKAGYRRFGWSKYRPIWPPGSASPFDVK